MHASLLFLGCVFVIFASIFDNPVHLYVRITLELNPSNSFQKEVTPEEQGIDALIHN